MTTFYEVRVNQTCKPIGSKENYYQYDILRETFATIAEAKAWLKEKYGNCKREKIYRDGKNGEAEHVGYIYCYNTPKTSYDDTAKNNQDWIEVRELKATTVIIK